jgi:hypothetical protein
MHYLSASAVRDLEGRLNERDWQIIRCVAGLHFLTGPQLTRRCFVGDGDPETNARAARRTLLRLTRLDVLGRLPRVVGGARFGSQGFVYYLGLGGQRLAISRGLLPERRTRRSRTPGTLFLRHTLLIAELHTQLVEADRSGSIELLELAAEPACWREFGGSGGQRLTLKPDSYVRLGLGPYEDSYFIEVDQGTEGSRTIERQLRAYVDYHASGREQAARGVFPKTLWTANTTERVAVIEDCVQRLPSTARELFQVVPFDDALTVMASVG